MPTNFQKAKRRVKLQNGNWSDPISYATSSESVELTDGTNLQTKIDNLGTASTKDVATSGDASANQVVMGNDSRLTNARPASDVSAWAKASTKPTYTASEVGAYTTTEVDNKIADTVSQCYHPAGSKTCAELISSLLVSANEGNVYDMSDSGTTTSDFREGAGHPIKAGDNVGIVNVGTIQSPVYKFDLLSGFVDLSAYYTKTESDNKYVAKETGKGLSTNDYTTADKNKLAGIEAGANKTVVDSAMSDSSTNPLQNKVITKELEGAKTTSGNPITVTDAAPVNAVNVSVDVEPIQDLHGYDHPWVGGAGKNKFATPATTLISNGITVETTESGEIWVHGTPTIDNNYISFSIADIPNNLIGKQLVISVDKKISGVGFSVGDGNLNLTMADTTKSKSAVYNPIPNEMIFTINVRYNVGTVNEKFKIQFEEGSIATSFAPYSNICPISGRSEVAIQRVGKNLCSEFVQGGYNGVTGAEIASTVYIRTGKIQIQPNTAYIFTREVNDGGEIYFWDKDLNFLSAEKITITWAVKQTPFTTPVNAKYCAMLIYKSGGITPSYITQPQLELGTTATEYEPYAGKTYTIQLGDTVYGAQYDVTRGKMVVTKGSCKINELEWGTQSSDYANFKTSSKANEILKSDNQIVVISELYIARSNKSVVRGGKQIYSNASGEIKINDTRYSTTTDFINAVGNSVIVYELATPYTIDLTPEQIKLLENTNTVYTDYEGDTITIEYQPNNAIGEAVRAVEENYDSVIAALEEKSNNAMQKGVDYVTAGLKSGSTIGLRATAEGYNTVPSGSNSHAEGSVTSASDYASHAEGNSTKASGQASHAEGYSTMASGDFSHAEGYATKASGYASHAEGYATCATNYASHSCGHYNAAMTTGGSANNTTGTAFVIGNGVHTSALSNAFSVQFNGVVKAASTITASTTADYAEFFEWSDENSNNEDRVGYFVTVDENEPTKIRIANSNDDYILGIVSGDPFVLGNGDCDVWNGMVMRDDFGRVIYEPAQKYEFNPETGEEEPVYDDEGNPVYEGVKPVYNPDYDPSIPYISRFDRKEWAPIGMLGVLHVYDDGTCEVNGYCTVGENGIATKTDSSTQISYKVIARINSNIIKVIFR